MEYILRLDKHSKLSDATNTFLHYETASLNAYLVSIFPPYQKSKALETKNENSWKKDAIC